VDRATYAKLMLGQLPAVDAARLIQHLGQCSRCATTVQGLQPSETLRNSLRQAATAGQLPAGVTADHLLARLTQFRPAPGPVTATAPSGHTQEPSPDRKTQPPAGTPTSAGKVPEQFGRYKIVKPLGEGGMGSVYLARDTQLDRLVALKVPHIQASDGRKVLDRFLREARSAATLRHPNLCPVYDVGEQDGTPYLTMAFIEGRPLAAYLRDEGLPPAQAATLVRKVALALHEAHAKGIIHRDLKPANIMIDDRKEPIVMDFGLARRVAPGEAKLTQFGQVMGTPSYMSPEQVSGDPEAMGPAADIYSLGVILYELLTGRLPFEGPPHIVLGLILAIEPPPASKYRPDVPPELEAICHKAMAKKATDRFTSMADFAQALTQYLKRATTLTAIPVATAVPPQQETMAARRMDGDVRRRGRSSRRSLVGAFVVILVLVGLGAGGLLLFMNRQPKESAAEVAAAPTQQASLAKHTEASKPEREPVEAPEPKKEVEPKKAADSKIDPEPKKEPEPKKDSEPKKEPDPEPKKEFEPKKESEAKKDAEPKKDREASKVIIDTSMGAIKVELFEDKAPITVKNFLGYVDDRFYDGTIFHRVMPTFVIQGGGFEPGLKEKQTRDPIKNEADNGLSNKRGTLAMARTNDPDSATSQFFINVADNLQQLDQTAQKPGYAVFGRVIEGMDVVDRIKAAKTGTKAGFRDVPLQDVVIRTVRRLETNEPVAKKDPDTDPIKDKLDKARADYRAEVEKFRAQLLAGLDKAEDAARQAGNKQRVDQIKAERSSFEKDGTPPTVVSSKEYQQQMSKARTSLLAAYRVAVAEYTKARKDTEAAALQNDPQFVELSQPPSGAFRALFNGKDLTGWTKFDSAQTDWTVEGGVLIGKNRGDQPNAALVSNRTDYSDFHLQCETMLCEGGPTFVDFRSDFSRPTKGFQRGYTVYIGGDEKTKPDPDRRITGSLLLDGVGLKEKLLKPASETALRGGRWIKLEIIATGPRTKIGINGKVVVDHTDPDKRFSTGSVALWCIIHTTVRFRNIEIKELSPKKP
jgi:serine/threonine protein kinase/cyclophilin family peptidyl-prolyl cis-trans isomerase